MGQNVKTMNKLVILLLTLITTYTYSQDYSRVKINTDSDGLKQLAELGVAIDHGTVKQGYFFISDFSASEIDIMRNNGFDIEIVIDDVQEYYLEHQNDVVEYTKNTTCSGATGGSEFTFADPTNFHLGTMGGAYTYQEFLDELDEMYAAYPTLITQKAPINAQLTHEGRPLYVVKISDNPNTDETSSETQVMHTSIHHAREPVSLVQNIYYMWYLLENYGTDEEVTYLVDNTEIFFIPMINPDGYMENETTDPNGGGMHRKNKRNVGTSNPGVDLNRNYSYQWNTTGVSPDVNNDTYPGTSAFSEPETQMMKDFIETHNIDFAFNCHTYGNLLLFPIGATNGEFAVDHDYFQAFTDHMTIYSGFFAQKSSGLYPASGDSDDYMYKDEGVFAMTPEVGNENFWPPVSSFVGQCRDMVFTNLKLSHMSHKYAVTEDTDPSGVSTITGDFNHDIIRFGQENGDYTVSITPITNIITVGTPVVHTLNVMEEASGTISYVLDAGIQYGDEIKYVLVTDNGLWQHRDTIIKQFGSATLQISDDASTTTNWTGDWNTTTSDFVSPSTSFTESPSGNYGNNSDYTYTFNQDIDLTVATAGMISYWAKWEIETDYDYCQFQVSTDGGNTWEAQCGNYTNLGVGGQTIQPNNKPLYDGFQTSWVKEEISLSDYLGQVIQVRFYLESDQGVREDGFYFDDFEVAFDGVNDASLAENTIQVKTFPNPAKDQVTVAFSEAMDNGEVKIFTLNGELIQSKSLSQTTNKVELNTNGLAQGVYMVQFSNNTKQSELTRLVIIK